MIKPGYKTTEFWIQLVPAILAIVTIANPEIARAIATIAAALSTSGYAIGRSVIKAKTDTMPVASVVTAAPVVAASVPNG